MKKHRGEDVTRRKHSTYYRRSTVEKEKHDHCFAKVRNIEKKAGKLNYNDNLGHHLVSRWTETISYKTQNVQKKQVAPWIRIETTTQFLHLSKHMVTSQSTLTTGGRWS